MKSLLLILALIVSGVISTASLAEAVEPIITNNVHVLKNVSPAQCPTSWKGTTSTADITSESAHGVSNFQEDAGIRSCDSCAFDQASGDCVCATCYDDYN